MIKHSCVVLLVLGIIGTFTPVQAQPGAFTHQGVITGEGTPLSGLYDMSSGLVSTAGTPATVATQTNLGVSVAEGVFTTTLNFGPFVFDGSPFSLEIGVRPAGDGSFTTLSPLQPLNRVPYAMRSLTTQFVPQLSELGLGGTNNSFGEETPDSIIAGVAEGALHGTNKKP